MYNTILKTLAAGSLCLLTMCATTPAPVNNSTDPVWLDQLVGKWEGDLGGPHYTEEWRKTGADTYEGTAVTTQDGKVVATENLRLTLFSDHWLYLANPGGQGVTCFVRQSADATTWIFENTEHDFPKRIGYRINSGTLTAWIAGSDDQEQRMEFALKRVK